MSGGMNTGRIIASRSTSPSAYCEGCGQRLTIGEPRGDDRWPSLLLLTPDQCALLLRAAAEYRDLSQKAGEPESVVAFLDWAFVDALRAKVLPPPDHDGAPPRWEKTGVTAGPHRASHRHPFPLPLGGRGVR